MNYNNIIKDLEKYKVSHPNLSSFWRFYIDLKKESFEKTLNECSETIKNFETMNDVNLINLWIVYLFQRSIYT